MKLDKNRKGVVWGMLLTSEQEEVKRVVGGQPLHSASGEG